MKRYYYIFLFLILLSSVIAYVPPYYYDLTLTLGNRTNTEQNYTGVKLILGESLTSTTSTTSTSSTSSTSSSSTSSTSSTSTSSTSTSSTSSSPTTTLYIHPNMTTGEYALYSLIGLVAIASLIYYIIEIFTSGFSVTNIFMMIFAVIFTVYYLMQVLRP